MLGERIRRLREAAGLTQAQLAVRAGVSRQLVGAVEAGRHLPRIDAGVALARALGKPVEALLDPQVPDVPGVLSKRSAAGSPVRLGRVGDQLVCAPLPATDDGWGVADGIVTDSGAELLPGARPGTVVVGCDPAIGLAGRLAADRSVDVLAVPASTAAALEALTAGRAHAAVVHGSAGALPTEPQPLRRWRLARWQVGLAAPAEARSGWWQQALAGRRRVVQREAGAASQAAFEQAVAAAGGRVAPGILAAGHVEAARLARLEGLVAVTIEPAAIATGLVFHPLEMHEAELWVADAWVDDPGVRRLVDVVASTGFQRRVAAVGGYDLTGCGTAVAA